MLRTGRRLAFDVGTSRIGVAVSDFNGIVSTPLVTLNAQLAVRDQLAQVLELVSEEILEIYVGYPISLSGAKTLSTESAELYAKKLQEITKIPVLLIDERLSTSLANQQLRDVGISQKEARSSIDQMAAVAILEHALDVERNLGVRPGKTLEAEPRD